MSTVNQLGSLVTRHRQLTWEMTKREVTERYAGHLLGITWTVTHPMVFIAVYLFIFGFVFKVQIGGTRDMPLDYITYLLSGLIPWLTIQDGLNRTPSAILSNTNLVKQVVFPIEVLPAKTVLATLLGQLVGTVMLVGYVLVHYHRLPASYLLLLPLIVIQTIFVIGVGYVFAAVAVYFRDLKDVVQVLTVIGVYLLPVLYLPTMVPPLFRPLLYLNPLSYVIWCFQDACYYGRFVHWWAWPVFVIGSLLALHYGLKVFNTLKPYFGNVL